MTRYWQEGQWPQVLIKAHVSLILPQPAGFQRSCNKMETHMPLTPSPGVCFKDTGCMRIQIS